MVMKRPRIDKESFETQVMLRTDTFEELTNMSNSNIGRIQPDAIFLAPR